MPQVPFKEASQQPIEQTRTALEKCTDLYDDTQGAIKNTSAFDTEPSSGIRREIENNTIIKEEGSKEEDRHGVEVKQL